MLLIILAGLVVFYYFLVRPYNFWKERGVKQGRPWILFGDTWGMVLRTMDMAQMVSYPYTLIPNVRYYGVYQFLRPKLMIRDPELIKHITVKDFDHFTDHTPMVDPKADPLFAKNLLGLRGNEWRKMRSTLTGSFTSSKMKIMFGLISEEAEHYVNYLAEKQDRKIVDIEMKDAFTRFTIDVIASTAFGVKVDSLKERDNEFFQMGKQITEISFIAVLKIMLFQVSAKVYRFLNFALFGKEVNEFFTNLINDTIKTREEKGIYRPDMLQILMEARKGVDKEDVNASEVGFAVTKEYIESLRKWPPFVMLGRECTKTYTIEPKFPDEKPLAIPKGMAVQIPIYAIHHDPKYYPEPEKFDPERFSPENRKNLNPYTFLGFGQGPRNCLGSRFALLEVKIIIFYLLSKFKFVTTDKTQIPLELSKKFAVNIRPEKGLWIGLQKLA